ncbi:bifunctional hydroxymethylpyrimidine kinase/phosphomethylpyrimidine kinase [uncultured Intestinimonas sp.]|uniref:bifunctional hydroxymethylpyrimidine kinase/phosphomethylpyrimidine kinase n=1 Tax=uncultured Intestinimonas sp. TaxID=1689265 RepID=UPI0025CF7E96|nr:bifunctional hydroxymethylpyrimidine kinase/phosphomethylpyrimidine kinase [uncultured Intestinimonas sp.]
MYTALTIAGSDPSGGAGIQADIKTMTAHGVYAMSAVTALTAQNTMGVTGILEVPPEFLAAQLESVFSDIPPDGVKVGMLPSPALVHVVAEELARRRPGAVVVDPVMVSTSGARLQAGTALEAMCRELFPLASLLTPNLPEAEALWGRPVRCPQEMEQAAQAIGARYGCAVLCKGGHLEGDAADYLWQPGGGRWYRRERICNPNAHGTGCTLSSAIVCHLAAGRPLEEAVSRAKDYVSGALAAMLDLGRGNGPLDHAFAIRSGRFDHRSITTGEDGRI